MSGLIAPSILSFDLTEIKPVLRTLVQNGAEIIHFDVMDGQFVPPITFGDAYVKQLRSVVAAQFEAHLMVEAPERQFEAFAEAGCRRIIFHAEATPHSYRLIQSLHHMGLEAGIAINPGTSVDAVLPVLDVVDLVLVMTVNPGWGGQEFIRSALDKVTAIRRARAEVHIEVDGGIGPETLALAQGAGANLFVVGSYLASAKDLGSAVSNLVSLCG